jgi:vacuolar-type H+-ATPase subunit I/STV1
MKKETKKEELPSQKRYREKNPSITFRLKKEDKQRLASIIAASGKPLSQWMTDFIREKMDLNEETSKLAKRVNQLENLNEEMRFNIPCSICKKPVFFSSSQGNWETEIYPKLIETFKKRHHPQCKPR